MTKKYIILGLKYLLQKSPIQLKENNKKLIFPREKGNGNDKTLGLALFFSGRNKTSNNKAVTSGLSLFYNRKTKLVAVTAITLAGVLTYYVKSISFDDDINERLAPSYKEYILDFIHKKEPQAQFPENKGVWFYVKGYIPTSEALIKTGKGAGNIASYTYNGMKYPFVQLFSSDKPRPITDDLPDSNQPKESVCSLSYVGKYLSSQLGKIQKILQNFSNMSSEEKCRTLFEWFTILNNIYTSMSMLQTAPAETILSQYSKYSGNLSNWIKKLLQEEEYERATTALACLTVLAVYLFLIAWSGVPLTDQMGNIAHSVCMFKDDPYIQEILMRTKDTLKEFLPSQLNCVNWTNISKVLCICRDLYMNLIPKA